MITITLCSFIVVTPLEIEQGVPDKCAKFHFSKNGNTIRVEKFTTLATSNVFLAPDGYVYVTGNHGVYRKKRLSAPIWSGAAQRSV